MSCHTHQTMPSGPAHPPWWKTRSGVVLCGFLLVGGFYLFTEHAAHVYGALPFLLVLACPLMHLFHHHGHGHGGHGGHGGAAPASLSGSDHEPENPQ